VAVFRFRRRSEPLHAGRYEIDGVFKLALRKTGSAKCCLFDFFVPDFLTKCRVIRVFRGFIRFFERSPTASPLVRNENAHLLPHKP
jgi:hypothetical protein